MNNVAATDVFIIPFNVIIVLCVSVQSKIINVKYLTAKNAILFARTHRTLPACVGYILAE